MALANIEKQQAKLKKLNEQIKQEKKKVDQRLGREIIKNAKLDYGNLDQKTIKELASKIVTYLNENSDNNSSVSSSNKASEPGTEFNQN